MYFIFVVILLMKSKYHKISICFLLNPFQVMFWRSKTNVLKKWKLNYKTIHSLNPSFNLPAHVSYLKLYVIVPSHKILHIHSFIYYLFIYIKISFQGFMLTYESSGSLLVILQLQKIHFACPFHSVFNCHPWPPGH
jgi:hypothetical protein